MTPIVSLLAPLGRFPWRGYVLFWYLRGGVNRQKLWSTGSGRQPTCPPQSTPVDWLLPNGFLDTHFLKTFDTPPPRSANSLTTWEKMSVNKSIDSHILSKIYQYLLLLYTPEELPIWNEWERELEQEVPRSNKLKIFNLTHSISTKMQGYRLFFRWYRTPVKLTYMTQGLSPNCWRCCIQTGTFMHLWWHCLKIQKFWEDILIWIYRISFFSSPSNVIP